MRDGSLSSNMQRAGFTYTEGVGWHQPVEPDTQPYVPLPRYETPTFDPVDELMNAPHHAERSLASFSVSS